MVLDNHNVNANEEGNNKEVNGRVAISGQKLKYMMLSSIKTLNEKSGGMGYVSNGDGATGDIVMDLRSDLGGYMITSDKNYSNRRTSPISVAYAVSENKSNFFDDLFVRFKMDKKDKKDKKASNETDEKHNKQRINNKTYSEKDIIGLSFALDCKYLSASEYFTYSDGRNLSSVMYNHVDEVERLRRVRMYIDSTKFLEGWANQSRNAIVNTPIEVFISFNTNSEFINYYNLNNTQRASLLKRLDNDGIRYFIGSDDSEYSVSDAYNDALLYLNSVEMVGSDNLVKTQAEVDLEFTEPVAENGKKKKADTKEEVVS